MFCRGLGSSPFNVRSAFASGERDRARRIGRITAGSGVMCQGDPAQCIGHSGGSVRRKATRSRQVVFLDRSASRVVERCRRLLKRAASKDATSAESEEVVGKSFSCRSISDIDAHFHILALGSVGEVRAGDKGARAVHDHALCVEACTGIASVE